MKLCTTCNTLKDEINFSKNSKKKCGLNSKCKLCHSKYLKLHYKKNPASYLNSSKKSKKRRNELIRKLKEAPCTDCKQSFPYYVMDFDHCRGEKNFLISQANRRYSDKRILSEIAKCDLVCANCHRIRTFTRNTLCSQQEPSKLPT